MKRSTRMRTRNDAGRRIALALTDEIMGDTMIEDTLIGESVRVGRALEGITLIVNKISC